MRMFKLSKAELREQVDLTLYTDIIEKAVHDIVPDAQVIVERDCYIVDNVSKGESIRIGRKLAATPLGEFSKEIYTLFSGSEM